MGSQGHNRNRLRHVTEGYTPSNPAASINLSRGNKPQIEILTRDEPAQLIRASYQHRYGVFIRLVLFTGLRLGELLGLRWEDIDMQSNLLHVRRTLNRLNKVKPTAPGEPTTEIVIQPPKSQNFIRSIPLLPVVIQDLMNWKSIQRNDQAMMGDQYRDSGMIVTNPSGGFIEPRTFKDQYDHTCPGRTEALYLPCPETHFRLQSHGAGNGCQDSIRTAGSRLCIVYHGYLRPCADRLQKGEHGPDGRPL